MSQSASTVVENSQVIFGRAPLPNGWRWVRLKDVGGIADGDWILTSDYAASGVRLIQVGDVGKGRFVGKSSRHITLERAKELNCTFLQAGDILISRMPDPMGRACVMPDLEYPCITAVDVSIWRPNSDIADREYLTHYLNSSEWYARVSGLASGATRQRISRLNLENLTVPLPSLSEQKRIAAILNEQTAAVERARTAAEAQLKATKDLPSAYLRSVFDSPQAQQWTRKRIGEVALLVQNGIYKAAEHYGHGHPFLRMYNVQNNSWALNLDRIALVNLEGKEEQTFALKCGDLLISRVNSFELVGKCAWVSPDAEGFVFENMLIRVQLDSSVNSLFVAQQMATDAVRKQVEAVAKRAIGQASINSADLRAIEIALPSLDIQEQMANELSARVAGAEQASKALQDQLSTIYKLPATLLRQAFTGKL